MHRLAAAILAALAIVVVPAAAAAQEQGAQYEVLPVPAITIYPGDVIEPGMLKDERFLPGTLSRYPVAGSADAIVGKVAKRTLAADRLILMNSIAEPELITQGALTTAVFALGGLSMTASVVALQSGALGQSIQIRNVDSGRIVAGVVQGDGSVRVGEMQ